MCKEEERLANVTKVGQREPGRTWVPCRLRDIFPNGTHLQMREAEAAGPAVSGSHWRCMLGWGFDESPEGRCQVAESLAERGW